MTTLASMTRALREREIAAMQSRNYRRALALQAQLAVLEETVDPDTADSLRQEIEDLNNDLFAARASHREAKTLAANLAVENTLLEEQLRIATGAA